MIKIIKQKKVAGFFQVEIEFTLFGRTPVSDIYIKKTEEEVAQYWNELKHMVLKYNFERIILSANDIIAREPKDSFVVAHERLSAANKYFAENNPTTAKTCEMILKLQKHLMSILPGSKHEDYDMLFSGVNELIGFCKKEVSDECDILSNA